VSNQLLRLELVIKQFGMCIGWVPKSLNWANLQRFLGTWVQSNNSKPKLKFPKLKLTCRCLSTSMSNVTHLLKTSRKLQN